MAIELIEIDAAWAEKWTKTGVPFLSAPTVPATLTWDDDPVVDACPSQKKPSRRQWSSVDPGGWVYDRGFENLRGVCVGGANTVTSLRSAAACHQVNLNITVNFVREMENIIIYTMLDI